MDRRAFLFTAAAAGIGAFAWKWKYFRPALLPSSPAEGRRLLVAPSLRAGPIPYSTLLSFLDLSSGAVTEHTLPLSLPHSWTSLTGRPGLGVIGESGGRGFCLVDAVERKVLEAFTTAKSSLLLGGHGACSPDGKYFFLSQFDLEREGAGGVLVLDAKTMQTIATLPSGGSFPHQVFSREQKVSAMNLGLAKAGEEAALWVEMALPSGGLQNSAEIRVNRSLVVADSRLSEEEQGEASYYLQVGRAAYESRPNAEGYVIHPYGAGLSFWDLEKNTFRLTRVVRFGGRQPVSAIPTADHRHLAVALADGSLVFVDFARGEISAELGARRLWASTHLARLELPR